jgi:RNA polymerase sigma factor (TIGR02999 family)
MPDVTQILSRIESGDPAAAERLLPLVYDELRKLAADRLAHEKPGQTLQATALVHEAYLRLIGPPDRQNPQWNNRGHFFAAAAEAMRRILVDQARQKRSLRRGGDFQRVELSAVEPTAEASPIDTLALDEALERFKTRDPRAAELVKLRFFAGLTVAEAASALAISVATAENDWAYAKSWLKLQLSQADSESLAH